MTENIVTRDEFIKIMKRVEAEFKKQSKLNDCFYELGFDGYLSWSGLEDTLLGVLTKMFNDKEDWIGYFYTEMDFGASYKPGMVVINGKDIPMRDAGDLYDLLIENMK